MRQRGAGSFHAEILLGGTPGSITDWCVNEGVTE